MATNACPPYELKPTTAKIKKIIDQVHHKHLLVQSKENNQSGKKVLYDADKVPDLTSQISDDVRDLLRDLDMPRYKYFVQVVIGEKKNQSFYIADRHLIDDKVDCHGSVSFQSNSFFCVTSAYGIYHY